MRAATLVCVFLGSTPLIGVHAVIADARTHLDSKTESRQIPQFASYPHYRPPNHLYPYLSKPGYYPHNYGHGYGYGAGTQQQQQQQQGVMEVLESIASRDQLHCVSKILCEMASGQGNNYGYKKPSGFINLESLATLLSGVDDNQASPLVKFGKAFVLGYTARHNSQCQYAYPDCPGDPDRLVHYLNNPNGGIFHFFNNFLSSTSNPNTNANQRLRPEAWKTRGERGSEPVPANSFHIYDYGASEDKRQYAWQFPSYDDSQIHNYGNDGGVLYHKKGKSLKFPNEHNDVATTDYKKTPSFYFPQN